MTSFKQTAKNIIKEIFSVTWTLFKIMIPILIVIKILEELGVIVWFGKLISPIMSLVGLPSEAGIILATTMVTNIYGGMIIFFSSSSSELLTIAQVSVLGSMMLFSHGILIEGSIAKRTGVSWLVTLSLRLGGAIIFGAILNFIYTSGNWLQQQNQPSFSPKRIDDSLQGWILNQIENLFWVFLIISVLIISLRILRYLHIEKLLSMLLQPILKLLGIGAKATNITIIGVTLGMSFGGGLLIKEADSGELSKEDIISSMAFLSLSHSLIEDTILVMLLGTHISAALWLKLLFTFLVVAIFTRWAKSRTDKFRYKFLIK